MLWEDSDWVNNFGQLTQWGRLISFDRRGSGLSDRSLTGITPESRSDDVIAVLDGADSATAVLVGAVDSAAVNLLTAALHPERVSAVGGISC